MFRFAAIVTTCVVLAGCTNGTSLGYPLAHNVITSEIVEGCRTKQRYTDWEVDIRVRVEGAGPAFDFASWSTLWLRGSLLVSESDSWMNFNGDGWPESYNVRAEYNEWSENHGEVVVTVDVSDFSHPNYLSEVYRATHPITWTSSELESVDD